MPAMRVDIESISRRRAGPAKREPKTTRAFAIVASLKFSEGGFCRAGLVRVTGMVLERGWESSNK